MTRRKNQRPSQNDDAQRSVPVEAGEPEEVPALSQMGGTFAERAKAVQAAENKAVKSATKKS